MSKYTERSFSIVAVDKFIQATRDSGYRDTSSAIAEIVDNSLQAGAKTISISFNVVDQQRYPIVCTVVDDGVGMDAVTLRTALSFGGSTRFNDRGGMGRYGMGLPNSSLSQAKHVTVYTWQEEQGQVLMSYLDLDEIASGLLTEVPEPVLVERPSVAEGLSAGTAVVWSSCDRLDNKRISTLSRKLQATLGRKFRYFLLNGVSIRVNGDVVVPIDPLFLHPDALYSGADPFSDELLYEIAADPDDPKITGIVRVRFAELPVISWSKLSNKEKHQRGISKGAGVSIIRGGREVDYGWYFLGGKRKENYDDWWRCEISFDPVLDEAFGITHTKQQIRPRPHVIEALSPDIETAARALNQRARRAHLQTKVAERLVISEVHAAKQDALLSPLPQSARSRDKRLLRALSKTLTTPSSASPHAGGTEYRIVPAALSQTVFFNYARDKGKLVLVINPEHPFYTKMYKPLLESDEPRDEALRTKLDLLLLAAARSEALLEERGQSEAAEQLRNVWSDTLATFLNG